MITRFPLAFFSFQAVLKKRLFFRVEPTVGMSVPLSSSPSWWDGEQHLPPLLPRGATWLSMIIPNVLWETWKCHCPSQLPEEIGLLIMSNNLNDEPLREGYYKQSCLNRFPGREQISKMRKTWNCQWQRRRESVSSCQSAEMWQGSLLKAPMHGQPAILQFIQASSSKGSLHPRHHKMGVEYSKEQDRISTLKDS